MPRSELRFLCHGGRQPSFPPARLSLRALAMIFLAATQKSSLPGSRHSDPSRANPPVPFRPGPAHLLWHPVTSGAVPWLSVCRQHIPGAPMLAGSPGSFGKGQAGGSHGWGFHPPFPPPALGKALE